MGSSVGNFNNSCLQMLICLQSSNLGVRMPGRALGTSAGGVIALKTLLALNRVDVTVVSLLLSIDDGGQKCSRRFVVEIETQTTVR